MDNRQVLRRQKEKFIAILDNTLEEEELPMEDLYWFFAAVEETLDCVIKASRGGPGSRRAKQQTERLGKIFVTNGSKRLREREAEDLKQYLIDIVERNENGRVVGLRNLSPEEKRTLAVRLPPGYLAELEKLRPQVQQVIDTAKRRNCLTLRSLAVRMLTDNHSESIDERTAWPVH